MLRISEGVTSFFRFKIQNDYTDNRVRMTKEKPRPENNNNLFVPEVWC